MDTINCTNGLRVFGQSVNNSISKSRLGANGGNASILIVKDGAIVGEWLMVAGTLLASGQYGIKSDGFLSLNVTGCVVDLIVNNAFDLTNCAVFLLSNSWVYAQNFGVYFVPLSVSVEQSAAITGNFIAAAASGGKAVYVGSNNVGVSVTGGTLSCAANGRLVHVDGSGVAVAGVHGVNTGTNPSMFFNGADCTAASNTGSMLVQWFLGVPSQGGTAVATAAFTGATGAALKAFQCNIVRNGVGDYTVTFDQPLASASYVPMVTLDRGGNGAMGYSVTNRLAGSFRFTCTNAAATAADPSIVWLAVFN